MTRRDFILKLLAYGITLVLCAIFNYFVFPLTPLPVPLLLPVCTVAAGCLEGGQFGAGFGVASGLLLATLGHGGWGCVALLAFVGWVSGLLGQYVLRQDLWGHVICCVVLLVVWEAVQLLGVATSTSAPLGVLLSLAAGEGLCSLVCAFPVYAMNRFCCVHYGRIYHE